MGSKAALGLILLGAGLLPAQQLPWQAGHSGSAAPQPVQYTWPEQVELRAGKPQEVDLHFAIETGLHINSHTPSDDSFIRTQLKVAEPPGIDVRSVAFPPGQSYTSKAFPGHTLSVYTGQLTLRAILVASRPGDYILPAELRYQACDLDTCLPPREAPVALDIVAR